MAKNSTYYEQLEELVRLARVIFDHVETHYDTISLEALDNALFQVSEYHREALSIVGDNIDHDSRVAVNALESYYEELQGMYYQKETDL
jgi:hypothetical protein